MIDRPPYRFREPVTDTENSLRFAESEKKALQRLCSDGIYSKVPRTLLTPPKHSVHRNMLCAGCHAPRIADRLRVQHALPESVTVRETPSSFKVFLKFMNFI